MFYPREWRWKDENGRMTLIKTDAKPAPVWLLKGVRCRCNISSKKRVERHYVYAEKIESTA